MIECKPKRVALIALKAGLVTRPIDDNRWSKAQDHFIVHRRVAGESYRKIAMAFAAKYDRVTYHSTVRDRLLRLAASEEASETTEAEAERMAAMGMTL